MKKMNNKGKDGDGSIFIDLNYIGKMKLSNYRKIEPSPFLRK